MRQALWLAPPLDQKTRRVGGKVWWWAPVFVVLVVIWQMATGALIAGPSVRDLGDFLGSDRAEHFFSGAWGWFAVVVALAVFNTTRTPSTGPPVHERWDYRLRALSRPTQRR
jgi:hypothetical protein